MSFKSYRYITISLLLFFALTNCGTQQPQQNEQEDQNGQQDKDGIEWLVNTTKKNLVFVEGGDFIEGDVGYTDENGNHHIFGGDGAKHPHPVTVESYSIQEYEISFKEYDIFTDATNGEMAAKEFRGYPPTREDLPVMGVTWQMANDYCTWLGEQCGLSMSLPTETQWEYAARSRGLAVEHATNNGKIENDINLAATEAPMEGYPSGHFPSNPLGIYDMTGSRAEWTKEKVVRGYSSSCATIYNRAFHDTDNGSNKGVRCVVNFTKPVLIEKPDSLK